MDRAIKKSLESLKSKATKEEAKLLKMDKKMDKKCKAKGKKR